jgi:hypothetical protein
MRLICLISRIFKAFRRHLKPCAALVIATTITLSAASAHAQRNIILDSDMGPDVDDAGSLAMLHTYADLGMVNILATISANKSTNCALSMDIINTYYGRPNIAVGVNKGASGENNPGWASNVVATHGGLTDLTAAAVPDALTVYKQQLAAAADHSVDIIVIGWQSNIRDLLQDSQGRSLVESKVNKIYFMAGINGDGFNVQRDAAAAQYVAQNTPAAIEPTIWSAQGNNIWTGRGINTQTGADNPVRTAYLTYRNNNPYVVNKSADQAAVLFAIEGESDYLHLSQPGNVNVTTTPGYTSWSYAANGGDRHVVGGINDDALAWRIDHLMVGDDTPLPVKTTPGVVFDYRFQYDASGYAQDSSGNGMRGTIVNLNTWTQGGGDDPTKAGFVTGGGLRMQGSNDASKRFQHYVQTPVLLSKAAGGMFAQSFELDVWATSDDAAGPWAPLIGYSVPDNSSVNRFYLAKNAGSGFSLNLRMGNINIGAIDTLGINVADGQSHQYTIAFDEELSTLQLLLDGMPLYTKTNFDLGTTYLGSLRIGNTAYPEMMTWDGVIARAQLSFIPEPAALMGLVILFPLLVMRRR